jgi:ribonuclease D
MGNKTLVAIAREQPTSMQGLEGIHGMTSSQIRRYGQDLLEAIRLGQKSRAPSRPKRKPLPDAVIQRYKRLRQWRKRTAASHHVESDLILPRDFLWDIARQAPRDRETLQEIMKPLEWRFQTYWEEILKIIRVG